MRLAGAFKGSILSAAVLAALTGIPGAPTSLGGAPVAVAEEAPDHGRQMIVRADDVGASKIYNEGVFEAVDNGVVTWVDIMLDSPGTIDALIKLKERPWISVGWHAHMWGSPVLPAAEVPSLVVPEGEEYAGRFREDIQTAPDVKFEEALAELRAQMELSIQYLGHPPTFGSPGLGMPMQGPVEPTPFLRAKQQVIDEYHLIDGWYNNMGKVEAEPKWADKKAWYTNMLPSVKDFYQTDSVADWEENYSPVNYYTEDRGGMLKLMDEGWTPIRAFHPGYLDLWTYRRMERGDRTMSRRFSLIRLLDLEGLTSNELKDWIRENRIALVSPKDLLFGRNAYQDHLKAVGSDLYIERDD
ncbi:ChbG/HpnK family deacetylase [Croceicoccus mobilis]|uniref:PTS cellbiose transporter subunit IIC n=1 Tax=Croceicoccus mobilis TaxID=1703339 RepID=A0A916Z779_9SPHN|nr:ChbG/HpnK family deacetylase [Croceicoccus mobilis]GGD79435.1 PTS cellbiose transporter subunit IIC [Croceicoccus mobilis]